MRLVAKIMEDESLSALYHIIILKMGFTRIKSTLYCEYDEMALCLSVLCRIGDGDPLQLLLREHL